MKPTYTYRCPECGVEQDVHKRNEFRHRIDCPVLNIIDGKKSRDHFEHLVRVWKPTRVIFKGIK
jgi:predicted nucleic acid-binding Zn ribbon protein